VTRIAGGGRLSAPLVALMRGLESRLLRAESARVVGRVPPAVLDAEAQPRADASRQLVIAANGKPSARLRLGGGWYEDSRSRCARPKRRNRQNRRIRTVLLGHVMDSGVLASLGTHAMSRRRCRGSRARRVGGPTTELTEPTELAMQGLICRFCQLCQQLAGTGVRPASMPGPRRQRRS